MKKKIFAIGFGILLLFVSFSGCFENNANIIEGKITKGEIIQNVEVDKTPLLPGEWANITVTVEEGSSCHFHSSRLAGGTGGGSMDYIGNNQYIERYVGSLQDDILWITIGASRSNGDLDWYELLIEVGDIEMSNISSLKISNVTYSPMNLTRDSSSLSITADATSNFTITEVTLLSAQIRPSGGGGGTGELLKENDNTYWNSISIHESEFGISIPTVILFKIVAQDESGNTAITPTYQLTIE